MNENKKDLSIQDFLKIQSQEGGGVALDYTPPENFNFLILHHIHIEIIFLNIENSPRTHPPPENIHKFPSSPPPRQIFWIRTCQDYIIGTYHTRNDEIQVKVPL